MAITIYYSWKCDLKRSGGGRSLPIQRQTSSIDTDSRTSQECQTATIIGFFLKYLAFIFNRATYIGEKQVETFSSSGMNAERCQPASREDEFAKKKEKREKKSGMLMTYRNGKMEWS